ncbi:MAG TPA: sugar phosphate isomerase/epimerase [Planctomycetota bacterium]|jgi:sugar phosphate isomerase/epimerase
MQNNGMTRREALSALGLTALAGSTLLSKPARAEDAKKKAGIALQLYTLRDPAKADLPGTLKKVADMGWKYVQWSGMPGLKSAEAIREALDKAGLQAIACHCSVEEFEKSFDERVKYWKTVGVKFVGPGGMMKDCSANLDGWKKGAQRFDELGAKLRTVDMRLTYHNHAGEFQKFPDDPRTKEDILLELTKPENVFAEFDIAWVAIGGADPAAYIRKYKGRCPTIHAKDMVMDGKKSKFTPLGKGSLKWDDIFAAGKESGIEWYIYEQDSGEGDPFAYTKESFDFLSKQSL